jgi:hypothetical protein
LRILKFTTFFSANFNSKGKLTPVGAQTWVFSSFGRRNHVYIVVHGPKKSNNKNSVVICIDHALENAYLGHISERAF